MKQRIHEALEREGAIGEMVKTLKANSTTRWERTQYPNEFIVRQVVLVACCDAVTLSTVIADVAEEVVMES